MTETNAPTAADLQADLQDFRKRIARGEEVTDEELRGAVRSLHAFRATAHTTLESASKKKATKAASTKTKAQKQDEAKTALGDLL